MKDFSNTFFFKTKQQNDVEQKLRVKISNGPIKLITLEFGVLHYRTTSFANYPLIAKKYT